MDLYEEIQNNQEKTNKENFAMLRNAYNTNPEMFGEFLISLSIGNENFCCPNPQLVSKIVNTKLESLLPLATEISPNTLFKTFELFEKELKTNIFTQPYKQSLLYKMYDDSMIVDTTTPLPQNLAQQIENMSLSEILSSDNEFVLNAGMSILEQIGLLAQHYDMLEVLKNSDTIEYVREDIKANIISNRPNISQEERNKRVDVVNRFGLDNYQNIITNLNTLWDYICKLNNTDTKQHLIDSFQNLHQNFNQWHADVVIDIAQQLIKEYQEENVSQLTANLTQMKDGECIDAIGEGYVLLSFISRDDYYQKKKESEFLSLGATEEELSEFLNKDAFERQTQRSNFLSFERASNFMKYKTNNSNVISASLFDINYISPHLNRKVAFGYGSGSLKQNSFLAISPKYLPIDSRENFKDIATPHTQILSSTNTNELLLDASYIGAPTYIMYVQTLPELNVSDPDYQWAFELANKHNLDFVIYNQYLMNKHNEDILESEPI